MPGGARPQDEFDHNVIVSSKPKDWTFETKNDFLPEASGQRMAQAQQPYPSIPATPAPVSPYYGNSPNMPGNNPINNTAAPGTGAPGQPGIAPQGMLPTQTTGMGIPQNSVNPNNPPRQNNQMAMPPQGNAGSVWK